MEMSTPNTHEATVHTHEAMKAGSDLVKEHMEASFDMCNKWVQIYWEWCNHMMTAWNPTVKKTL